MTSGLAVPLSRLTADSSTDVRDGLVQLQSLLKLVAKEQVLAACVSQHVAAAMQSHLANPEVQRWGAAILQEVFQRFGLVGQRDVEVLLQAASLHGGALDVQRWCFSALLCALEVDGTDETSDSTVLACILLEKDALGVLAAASAHKSPSLLERLYSLIAALLLEGGSDAADEATRTGCLGSTLATLKLTLGTATEVLEEETSTLVADLPVQLACLRVLWAICEANGELGATEIAAKDGLDIIIAILHECGPAVDVRKWSASVLQSLFAQGGELVVETAVQLEAAEALVMSLACSLNSQEVAERCAAALATMASFSDEAGLAVVEAGGLGAVEEAVARHGSEGDLAQWYFALRASIHSCTGEGGPSPDDHESEAPEAEIEL